MSAPLWLTLLASWLVVSVPLAILVGRAIALGNTETDR